MSTIRTLTPSIDPETDASIKLQVWVSLKQKRRILAAFGDDGVYTFIIRTQFQRLYDFITTNDLTCDDPTAFRRLVEFVRNGADTRSNRPAAALDDTRTATRLQHKNATTPSQSGGTGASSTSGVRKQDKVKRKE